MSRSESSKIQQGSEIHAELERVLDRVLGTEPESIGECQSCGKPTHEGDPRPWACSTKCFADIVGIYGPDW